MHTSRQEVIAVLKSCQPVYHKVMEDARFQPAQADLECLRKFERLWTAGLLLQEEMYEAAGMSYEEYGFLIGYANELKQKDIL